jgi:hypothetical protein
MSTDETNPCDCSNIWPEDAVASIDAAWVRMCARHPDGDLRRHREFARVVGETVAEHLMSQLHHWAERHACVRLRFQNGRPAAWPDEDESREAARVLAMEALAACQGSTTP